MKQIFGVVVVGMAAVASALPAQWQESSIISKRQNPATGLPDGLGDIDILQLYASSSPFFLHPLTDVAP